jgi:hypothetical protein
VLLIKQKQFLGVHISLTIQSLKEIIQFFHPRRLELQKQIERLRAPGPLPAALYTLTSPSNTDLVTLGGLVPRTKPAPFHSQIPEGNKTAVPPVAVPTPLTSEGDHDANDDSDLDELKDAKDLYTDADSEMQEVTEVDEFFFAAADACLGPQHMG